MAHCRNGTATTEALLNAKTFLEGLSEAERASIFDLAGTRNSSPERQAGECPCSLKVRGCCAAAQHKPCLCAFVLTALQEQQQNGAMSQLSGVPKAGSCCLVCMAACLQPSTGSSSSMHCCQTVLQPPVQHCTPAPRLRAGRRSGSRAMCC